MFSSEPRRSKRPSQQKRPTGTNIKPETRALIIETGIRLEAEKHNWGLTRTWRHKPQSTKVKYTDIANAIGANHAESHNRLLNCRVVKRWWDKRRDFQATATLLHGPRSGRPIHSAIDTPQKLQGVVDYCLGLKVGEHQPHVLAQFDMSINTLRKYTKNLISWVYPPKQHVNDTAEVQQKRVDYARWASTKTWQPTQRVKNATFIDHKMVSWLGLNRTHYMQAKLKTDTYENLMPMSYLLNSPAIMTYFACNISGVSSYMHVWQRAKMRGSGNTVDVWKVDEDDCIEAFQGNFLQFMRESDSDFLIMDGCRTQHSAKVYDYFADNHIQVHPSAGKPRKTKNGYPPYSHCFMPLDHRVFAPFQQDISRQCQEFENTRTFDLYNDSRLALLYDIITPTFETARYEQLAANDIMNYGKTCRAVIERNGNIKGMK